MAREGVCVAVVTLRLVSAEVGAGAAELLAYGTAVRIEPE